MSPRRPSSLCSRLRIEAGPEVGQPAPAPDGPPPPFGLYLHLPFCRRKCAYCDFASAPLEALGGLPFAARYLRALAVELDLRAASDEFWGAPVETIYLGGGTPTVLPSEWLADLLTRARRLFPVAGDCEVTVEANPGTVNNASLEALFAAGVNRLSLGVQSLDDAVLRTLRRAHDAAQAEAAAQAARAAGCRNLSVDLIYGVPGQSLESWRQTLSRALALGPEHISCYPLSLEPGTPLAEGVATGRLAEPDEDLCADMFTLAARLLTEAGYCHYEISNLARPGWECRHNRRYWGNDEYLGVGASAHSFRGGVRWNNAGDPRVYTGWLERGLLPVVRAEALSPRGRLGEMLMLGLRRAEGVCEQELAACCGIAPREAFGREIERLCAEGLLVAGEGWLRIPREHWLVSNEVLQEFAG